VLLGTEVNAVQVALPLLLLDELPPLLLPVLPDPLPEALPLELLDELPLLLPEPPSPSVACESPELLASESGAALDSESHVMLLSKASSIESATELSNDGPSSAGPTSGWFPQSHASYPVPSLRHD
jgi:hypothetical protein